MSERWPFMLSYALCQGLVVSEEGEQPDRDDVLAACVRDWGLVESAPEAMDSFDSEGDLLATAIALGNQLCAGSVGLEPNTVDKLKNVIASGLSNSRSAFYQRMSESNIDRSTLDPSCMLRQGTRRNLDPSLAAPSHFEAQVKRIGEVLESLPARTPAKAKKKAEPKKSKSGTAQRPRAVRLQEDNPEWNSERAACALEFARLCGVSATAITIEVIGLLGRVTNRRNAFVESVLRGERNLPSDIATRLDAELVRRKVPPGDFDSQVLVKPPGKRAR